MREMSEVILTRIQWAIELVCVLSYAGSTVKKWDNSQQKAYIEAKG